MPPSHARHGAGRPVALITGAGRRVGAVIARTLHAAGYDLALHYRHSADEARALADALETERGASTLLLQAELADFAGATREAVAKTLAVWRAKGRTCAPKLWNFSSHGWALSAHGHAARRSTTQGFKAPS